MINREITYERDMNRSYMIIPAMPEESFDEKMLLKKNIEGLLPVEKCYTAGCGQYWYNISGKQALDVYCRNNPIGNVFLENIILRFCEQVERVEWNLLDVNCLVADPELIFVNHSGDEISFLLYPFHREDLSMELQQLMEYLLKRLDHKNPMAVDAAYKLYEMILSEGISVLDLKKHILDARMKSVVTEPEKILVSTPKERTGEEEQEPLSEERDYVSKAFVFLEKKMALLFEKVREILGKKEIPLPSIVYPEEEPEETLQAGHPTVCVGSSSSAVRGELICDRRDTFRDFQLEKSAVILGKNPKVQLHIDKDTISQFHARIEYQDGGYYIEDLNSTNGTYINDKVLNYKSKQRLEAGDRVRFADVGYRFY